MRRRRKRTHDGHCPTSGKLRYSQEAALIAAAELLAKGEDQAARPLHAYHCEDCGSHHIGHLSFRKRL